MMKMLVIADIHGDFEKLEKLVSKVRNEKYDAIICPGDFTDMFSIPKEFSQMDIADLILQKLLALNMPLLCVPGNHDPYEIIDLFNEYGVNLHASLMKIKDMPFIGWGGALTPFNTIFEPSDEETGEALKSLGSRVEPSQFILITHDPPKNTNVDKTSSGNHVGSLVVRSFIENNKPILAISAHIHEASGMDQLGETKIFYPGALFMGKYGVVSIEEKKVTCETKTFD